MLVRDIANLTPLMYKSWRCEISLRKIIIELISKNRKDKIARRDKTKLRYLTSNG